MGHCRRDQRRAPGPPPGAGDPVGRRLSVVSSGHRRRQDEEEGGPLQPAPFPPLHVTGVAAHCDATRAPTEPTRRGQRAAKVRGARSRLPARAPHTSEADGESLQVELSAAWGAGYVLRFLISSLSQRAQQARGSLYKEIVPCFLRSPAGTAL
ncbi:unnamed protein product [Prorocentrum cordatum]|uniref:Uncharacterized protein n=1 Tax=Prorocentrum cordatum TaxID=2364126 RepID=A0ABN9V9D4_9DINO|nr:unnamed protein product [Polarella glacialis]